MPSGGCVAQCLENWACNSFYMIGVTALDTVSSHSTRVLGALNPDLAATLSLA